MPSMRSKRVLLLTWTRAVPRSGVVQAEALGLAVHGDDLALELTQRSLRGGDGRRGEQSDGCDESDEFHVVRVPGALSSTGEPPSKLS
jgi:hypothetical protein